MKKMRQSGSVAMSQESLQEQKLKTDEFDVQQVDQCSYFITFKIYGPGKDNKPKPTNFNEIR
jgi:hypothetical protein